MITTLEQLYNHVNRFHGLPARHVHEDGDLVFEGVGRVRWVSKSTQRSFSVGEDDFRDLTVRIPGDGDYWVPLLEYDDQAAAKRIERWEDRHGFEMALKNAREATEHLRNATEQLHVDDRAFVREQYGIALGNLTPEYEEGATVWPNE